jgi:metal-responsive CopG/Arc/MetJ family transcriptional regulator
MTTAASTETVVVRMSKKAIQRLDKAARARGLKRSELVREVLESTLAQSVDLAEEARRQSLLVSRLKSERDALGFIESALSTDGWT